MYLDSGTIVGITIALAGAIFVMIMGLRRSMELEKAIRRKNKRIMELEAELNRGKRKERV